MVRAVFANVLMAVYRVRPKPAFCRFPPVDKADPEGQQRVDMARSPSRRRMAGVCAQLPSK